MTAVLSSDTNLLIGTGSGTVLIYKVLQWKNATPARGKFIQIICLSLKSPLTNVVQPLVIVMW